VLHILEIVFLELFAWTIILLISAFKRLGLKPEPLAPGFSH
jgi:hypothetical protein